MFHIWSKNIEDQGNYKEKKAGKWAYQKQFFLNNFFLCKFWKNIWTTKVRNDNLHITLKSYVDILIFEKVIKKKLTGFYEYGR